MVRRTLFLKLVELSQTNCAFVALAEGNSAN
jgi:hypothetical protein